MSDKSHVGMGFAVCPICGQKHDEVVLLDKRLKNSLDRENFTGWLLCPTHKAMEAEFIALVEVEEEPKGDEHTKLATAKRTGNLAHVRRAVWNDIFNVSPPKFMCFVPVGVIQKIQGMVPHEEHDNSQQVTNGATEVQAPGNEADGSPSGEPEA